MAEQQAAATEAASTETQTAAEATSEPAVELRAELIEKLKASRAAREAGTTDAEPKPKKPAKPKDGKAEPKKPAESGADENAAHEGDSPEVAAYKAERRAFAKQKRKKEAEFSSREAQLKDFETRAQAELESVQKDPVSWLKARGVNLRKLLTDMANEDSEDPRDKKLRELEQKQKGLEEETKREREEREARELKAKQAEGTRIVETEMGKAWKEAEVDDYPTVATALEPEHVAQRAAEIAIAHFREWFDGGRKGKYKELAPSEVFAIMEEELAPLKGKLANPKKGKPPEQVRAASGSRKAATPEAPTTRERPTRDVTRSASREATVGRPQNFSREALRERLVEKVREAAR